MTKFFDSLIFILLAIPAAILLVDIISILDDPESYRIAHNFTNTNLSWHSPDVLTYIARNLIVAAVMVFALSMNITKVKGNLKRDWIIVYYCSSGLYILYLITTYCLWTKNGYDH